MTTIPTPAPLSPEREAAIRSERYTVRSLASADVALDDVLAELDRLRAERAETNGKLTELTVALRAAEKRVAELEAAATVTEYGIRVPGADWPDDGVLQDGDTFNLKDQQDRLLSYRDCWPDAVLVSRPVRRGEWTEAE